ncbi:chemotaxis protein CheA [Sphingomonas silueang]|uniref:chemotaxis protein CheA n=1 Tax=Sphingomonas silueang TaxID=3156617 RepID=UPI0032B48A7E
MDDLLQEFIAETRETLEALAGEIVAWEAAPDDRARLDAIFRFVHTVKGSCGFLDLPRLSRLSHAAEDVLADVRDGRRRPDRALVDAVLAIVDRIGALVEAIDAGAPLSDEGEERLIAALAPGGSPPVSPPVEPSRTSARGVRRNVRLNIDLLDRMMVGMSDMVLVRNELVRRLRDIDLDPALEAAVERLSASVADMRDAVMRTRMQKIETLFSALPRMVRDTAATLGKAVTLTIDGSDVELDREMVEVMRDPLLHIVRNAIDHGIEAPAERRAAGKRETGRLHITARQSGNQIMLEIADDGRGIDTDALIRKLARQGERSEAELRALSPAARCELVFAPGLSSRDTATEISGRGVGMDVVKAAVDQIGGRIALDNMPGRGLRIALQIPLTLSIVSTIIVRAGEHHFAIPRQSIGEIVNRRAANIRVDRIGGAQVATVRDRRLPVVDLCDLLGVERGAAPGGEMLVVIGIGAGDYALAVDQLCDTEELVVKPAAPAVMAVGLYTGQTLPDTGQPMLLLDCAGVAQVAGLHFGDRLQPADDAQEQADPAIPALLFEDLDGERRVMALAVIDRIEKVAPGNLRTTAGRLRLSIDGRIVPVEAMGPCDLTCPVELLRLTDGTVEVAYAIRAALDIVGLPEEMVPATVAGPVAGVVMLDGEQVERIDPLWLFEQHVAVGAAGRAARPTCLLTDAGGWMGTFLRPMLEQAGYRTIDRIEGDATPALILAPAGEAVAGGVPVVRLRDRADDTGDGSIYRYDREGVLRAVRRVTGA